MIERFFRSRSDDADPTRLERLARAAKSRLVDEGTPLPFRHNGTSLEVAWATTPEGLRLHLFRTMPPERLDAGPQSWDAFGELAELLDHIADGVTVIDAAGCIVAANAEFRSLYDVSADSSVIGATLADVVRAAWGRAGQVVGDAHPTLARPLPWPGPLEIELPGGRWRRVSARPLAGGAGYVSHADITVQKRQQAELLAAERRAREGEYRYRLLAENTNDVIVATRADLSIQFVSPAAERVLGWPPEEMVGAPLTVFIHEDARTAFAVERDDRGRAAHRHATFTCQMLTRSGAWIWMEVSLGILPEAVAGDTAIALVCSFRDVTERVRAERALKLAHDELSSMAATDPLTGVANRRRFDSALDAEWRRAVREGQDISLMLIDVDHFKAVNDGHGHVVGDECLRRVATLIRMCVHRPGDLVARYGGEEFVVLLPQTPLVGARAIADRIRASVAMEPWPRISPSLPGLTVSIGLCSARAGDAIPMAKLIRRADEALYRAKNAGRDRCEVDELV